MCSRQLNSTKQQQHKGWGPALPICNQFVELILCQRMRSGYEIDKSDGSGWELKKGGVQGFFVGWVDIKLALK